MYMSTPNRELAMSISILRLVCSTMRVFLSRRRTLPSNLSPSFLYLCVHILLLYIILKLRVCLAASASAVGGACIMITAMPHIWPHAIALASVFWVTLALFPGITSRMRITSVCVCVDSIGMKF
jgi:hypothetical protein